MTTTAPTTDPWHVPPAPPTPLPDLVERYSPAHGYATIAVLPHDVVLGDVVDHTDGLMVVTEITRRHATWTLGGENPALPRRVPNPQRGRRLRLRYQGWPRPAIVLTDTPRPTCTLCLGHGGWLEDYAGPDGEYGGTEQITCDCWTSWSLTLLALPRRIAEARNRRAEHRLPAGYSQEPPF